jgi:hypothetical protein
VIQNGVEPLAPGLMSLTSFVPLRVPSERHSSRPVPCAQALKKSAPPTFASSSGFESPPPELMSRTRFVPLRVPFERHSSYPWAASPSLKNRVPATFVSHVG